MRIYLLIIWSAMVMIGCSKKEISVPEMSILGRGQFVDTRDGNTYGWVRIGDLEWMTENYRYASAGALHYIESSTVTESEVEDFVKTYGRLYNMESAKGALPKDGGWRIPTDEDWQHLERNIGLSSDESSQTGWRGAELGTLLRDKTSPFHLDLGGMRGTRSADYAFKDIYGFYWSSTRDQLKYNDFDNYIMRQISLYSPNVLRESIISTKFLSLRLVRDVKSGGQ